MASIPSRPLYAKRRNDLGHSPGLPVYVDASFTFPEPVHLKKHHRGVAIRELRQFEATPSDSVDSRNGKRIRTSIRSFVPSSYWTLTFSIVFLNIGILISVAARQSLSSRLCSSAVAINLLVAAVARNEHFINTIFRLACSVPTKAPLCIRRWVSRVYCYGGIHVGCGISALLWYVAFTVQLSLQIEQQRTLYLCINSIGTFIIVLMVITSVPAVRVKFHNQWEIIHRFGAWAFLCLVWTQTILQGHYDSKAQAVPLGTSLVHHPSFWLLIVITCLLIYPWLRVRRRNIHVQQLSPHSAQISFDDATLPSCVGVKLSRSPIRDNHSFATIPSFGGGIGYSCVISRAGDWTDELISNPPQKIWTRGGWTTGVMRIASLFEPVLIVTTGSGIGPCLSFLQVYFRRSVRVLWSARSPLQTYGPEILNAVYRADQNAKIIDTKGNHRPDLAAISYEMAVAHKAEAVIVISNQRVTEKIVSHLKSRGVFAVGPIFDS